MASKPDSAEGTPCSSAPRTGRWRNSGSGCKANRALALNEKERKEWRSSTGTAAKDMTAAQRESLFSNSWESDTRNTRCTSATHTKCELALARLKQHQAEGKAPERWIETTQATLIFAVVIALNVVVIGVQADNPPPAVDWGNGAYICWFVIESLFNIIFIVEIVLRLQLEGRAFFGKAANLFDLGLVMLSVLDTWIIGFLASIAGDSLRFVTLFRVLRLLRLLRIVRLFRLFETLWQVVSSLVNAFCGLIWILLISFIFCYTFAVILRLTLGITMEDKLEGDELTTARVRWGTVIRSVFTLFVCMVGDAWYDILMDAVQVEEYMYAIFIPFMCIGHLMLMNLFIGIMCQKVHEEHQDYERELIKKADDETIMALAAIFILIDDDSSGCISLEELVSACQCDTVKAKFDAIDIHPSTNASALYRFFDTSQDGDICFEEFVHGCMALKHADFDAKIWFLQDDLHDCTAQILQAVQDPQALCRGNEPKGADRSNVQEVPKLGVPTRQDMNGVSSNIVQVLEETMREQRKILEASLKEQCKALRKQVAEDMAKIIDAKLTAEVKSLRKGLHQKNEASPSPDDLDLLESKEVLPAAVPVAAGLPRAQPAFTASSGLKAGQYKPAPKGPKTVAAPETEVPVEQRTKAGQPGGEAGALVKDGDGGVQNLTPNNAEAGVSGAEKRQQKKNGVKKK